MWRHCNASAPAVIVCDGGAILCDNLWNIQLRGLVSHDDVIKWKHFPRYWPFVRGIHRSQRPVTRSFDVFFDLRPNKRLSKQSRGWWLETPSRSLWHHCNELINANINRILFHKTYMFQFPRAGDCLLIFVFLWRVAASTSPDDISPVPLTSVSFADVHWYILGSVFISYSTFFAVCGFLHWYYYNRQKDTVSLVHHWTYPNQPGLDCWLKSMLNSMLVNKDFLTWLLIGW